MFPIKNANVQWVDQPQEKHPLGLNDTHLPFPPCQQKPNPLRKTVLESIRSFWGHTHAIGAHTYTHIQACTHIQHAYAHARMHIHTYFLIK